MGLFTQLEKFNYSHSEEKEKAYKELQDRFAEIAKTLFYGGYIDVYGVYRIYIRCAEFYFHEENGIVKDEIVYHREDKYKGLYPKISELPTFPTMSLHAHMSGFDITFETKEIRASALIRAYSVFGSNGETIVDKDDRSTFLYYLLNGFPLNQEKPVAWIDDDSGEKRELKAPTPRRNVFEYINGEKQKTKDKRQWSFSPTIEVTP